MKHLSLDLETFSGVDIGKAGVYKYAESPDFEILLLGYSVDGGEVRVVDLAQGEVVPDEIIDALTDDSVTKWAFNCQFERICLSRWLQQQGLSLHNDCYSIPEDSVRNYLDPSSWRCSMIWSAYLGLPLSLASVGATLGLEQQKMTEGKNLIRYFCMPCIPTQTNALRTRNYPCDAPDKSMPFS